MVQVGIVWPSDPVLPQVRENGICEIQPTLLNMQHNFVSHFVSQTHEKCDTKAKK